MVDSPRRMKDSATGRRGTLFASPHIPAPCFDNGGREASFDDGERFEGPEGSGRAVVKSECCLGVKFVTVGSRISGCFESAAIPL